MERGQEAIGEVAACGDPSIIRDTRTVGPRNGKVLETDQLNHQLMASVVKEARLHLLMPCLNS